MGGFFDEDNIRFEKTLLVFALLVLAYFGSYVVIRYHNTEPCDYDYCFRPVVTVSRTVAVVYPLPVLLDERVITCHEFRFAD